MTAVPEDTEPSQAARIRETWREQKFAIKVAGIVATMPTILAAQGMVTVTTDVLHSPIWMALLLAGFLEGGLVASALLARDAAVHGLPTAVDSAAVWTLSVLSGLLSASHELIGPLSDGTRGWTFTAPQVEAAAVRLIVPLVAAWIWERVLVNTKREVAARTAAEVRLDRRCLAFGRSVQMVRRLDTGDATPGHVRRLRQWSARRRFDRQHVALLRRMPATDTGLRLRTMVWVAEVAGADNLYLSAGQEAGPVLVRDLDVWPAVGQASHMEPNSGLRAGSPDQGEPARGPGDRQEWTTPDHVGHQGPAQGGPGWSTEPETGQQLTQDVGHRAGEPAAEPLTGPAVGHPGPVQDQAGPGVDPVGRGPVVAAAEAAIRDANVLELWAGGMSQRNIATHLGISRSTVGRAVTRGNAGELPAHEWVDQPHAEMAPVDQQPIGAGASLIQADLLDHLDHGPAH